MNLAWLKTMCIFLGCSAAEAYASEALAADPAESKTLQTDNTSEASGKIAPLDIETLEFIAEFGDVDQEQFEIMMFHGKRDVEQKQQEKKDQEKQPAPSLSEEQVKQQFQQQILKQPATKNQREEKSL